MDRATLLPLFLISLLVVAGARAEFDDLPEEETDTGSEYAPPPPSTPAKQSSSSRRTKERDKKKFFVADTERVDAGTFHAGIALGGNFYFEPTVTSAGAPTGNYSKDIGFQGGVFFDYDYHDIALGLRGFVGYKYILNTVHCFDFEGIVRHLFTLSDQVKLGLGAGVSAAIWYRISSPAVLYGGGEMSFIPSLVIESGLEFNPFMANLRWIINRIAIDNTITGFELMFGVRL